MSAAIDVPQHLSLACRYTNLHYACAGVVHLGGPTGTRVPCECPECHHQPDQPPR